MKRKLFSILLAFGVIAIVLLDFAKTNAAPQGLTTLSAGQAVTVKASGCDLMVTRDSTARVQVKCVASEELRAQARRSGAATVILELGQSQKILANQCRLNILKNTSAVLKVKCVAIFSTATIKVQGAQFTALAVYEKGNKLFAANDNGESVIVFDGTTFKKLATISGVGGAVFEMVVNETYGKVYAASDLACCTSDVTPGTGKIAVIDATSNQLIKEIDPGEHYAFSFFLLGHDEVRDKVYVAWKEGVGVIDVATDTFTPITGVDYPYPYLDKIAINPVTNQVFLPHFGTERINIINGNTLAVSFYNLWNSGAWDPLDIVANEKENRLYLTMIHVPNQGEMGIMRIDLDTNTHKFVGKEDLEPLVFNPKSNQLFAGVQVGSRGAIVDGKNDALTYVPLGTGGVGAGNVRTATNRAYFATTDETYIVDGNAKSLLRRIPSGFNSGSGIFSWSVEINQKTGKVFVVNNDHKGIIQVIQD